MDGLMEELHGPEFAIAVCFVIFVVGTFKMMKQGVSQYLSVQAEKIAQTFADANAQYLEASELFRVAQVRKDALSATVLEITTSSSRNTLAQIEHHKKQLKDDLALRERKFAAAVNSEHVALREEVQGVVRYYIMEYADEYFHDRSKSKMPIYVADQLQNNKIAS